MTEHIVSSYDTVLDELKALVTRMGNDAISMCERAVIAVISSDIQTARDVVIFDKNINQVEYEIREQASSILALRAPMANDLRSVIGAIQIAANLERVGDLSKNIAKIGKKNELFIKYEFRAELEKISHLAATNLGNVMSAYIEQDSERAHSVLKADKDLDRLHKKFTKILISKMRETSDDIETLTQLLFVSRYLERVGDHAKNIAESIIYIETGETGALDNVEDQHRDN